MLGSELPKPHGVVIAERHQDWRRAAIGPFTGAGRARRSVGLYESQTPGHEQDGRRFLPADAEPLGLGRGMQERGAAAVLCQAANPSSDLVAIEGRIEPDAAGPWLANSVVGFA